MGLSIYKHILIVCLLLWASSSQILAQKTSGFFYPSDSLAKDRVWLASSLSAAFYTGTVIGLNELWYKDFPRSSFHGFNDWQEWKNMDKAGHAFTARWTGMKEKSSIWWSMGLSTLFQGTIEVLDGYSDKWGFSIYDIGFNTLGTGIFGLQQALWHEQRILFKVSNSFPNYNDINSIRNSDGNFFPVTERTNDLFGTQIPARFIKDYNGQTIWVSINLKSFMPESKLPPWLNVAVGYGVENVFGGFGNSWTIDSEGYTVSQDLYPRISQYYLALDFDLRKIKTRSRFLQSVLKALNVVKFPAPAIEFNSNGKVKFRPLYF